MFAGNHRTPSKQKVTISVGQALLMLLDKHKNLPTDKLYELKELYLCGAINDKNKLLLEEYLQDPILADYTICKDSTVINEDPTRRYFETHLAHHTLRNQISSVSSVTLRILEVHLEILSLGKINAATKKIMDNIASGNTAETAGIDFEYAELVRQLQTQTFINELTEKENRKLRFYVKLSMHCLMLLEMIDLPIDIYHKSFFKKERRGRMRKQDQESCRSANRGIMKSYMPTPQNDTAYSDTLFDETRAVDKHDPILDASWTKYNFDLLVHPFSCSISGTMLAILRAFNKLNEYGLLILDDYVSLRNFMRIYISLMLYHSGGHTLHEYSALFLLKEIRDAYKFMPNFDHIHLSTLFLYNNLEAFDAALSETIAYNQQILKRHAVLAELHLQPHTLFYHAQIDQTLAEPNNQFAANTI